MGLNVLDLEKFKNATVDDCPVYPAALISSELKQKGVDVERLRAQSNGYFDDYLDAIHQIHNFAFSEDEFARPDPAYEKLAKIEARLGFPQGYTRDLLGGLAKESYIRAYNDAQDALIEYAAEGAAADMFSAGFDAICAAKSAGQEIDKERVSSWFTLGCASAYSNTLANIGNALEKENFNSLKRHYGYARFFLTCAGGPDVEMYFGYGNSGELIRTSASVLKNNALNAMESSAQDGDAEAVKKSIEEAFEYSQVSGDGFDFDLTDRMLRHAYKRAYEINMNMAQSSISNGASLKEVHKYLEAASESAREAENMREEPAYP